MCTLCWHTVPARPPRCHKFISRRQIYGRDCPSCLPPFGKAGRPMSEEGVPFWRHLDGKGTMGNVPLGKGHQQPTNPLPTLNCCLQSQSFPSTQQQQQQQQWIIRPLSPFHSSRAPFAARRLETAVPPNCWPQGQIVAYSKSKLNLNVPPIFSANSLSAGDQQPKMASSRKKSVWNPGLEELDHFQLQGCQHQQAAAFSSNSNEYDKEAEGDEEQRQRQEENGNDQIRQNLPPPHQMPSSAPVPFMPMPPSFGHPNHPFALLAAHFHHQQQQQQQQQHLATNKLMTPPPPTPFLLPKMLMPPNFAALPTSMGPSPRFFPFGPAAMVLAAAAAAQRNQLLAMNNVNSNSSNVEHPMAGWRMPFHHFCPADRRMIGSINVGGQNAVAAHPPPQAMLAQTAAEFAGDQETSKKPAKKSIKKRKQQPSREEEMEEVERKRKKRNNGNGGQREKEAQSKKIAGVAADFGKTAAAATRVGGGNPIVELLLLGEQNEKKPSPPIVVNFNTCAVCGAQFRLTAELVQHARTNHRHSSRYDREQQPTSIAEAQLREERLKKMEQQKGRAAKEEALTEESG